MRFASQRIQIAAKYSSEQHPSELSLGPASSENSTRKVVLSVEQCVVFPLSWKLKMGPPLKCWRAVVSRYKVSCLHTSVPWSLKMSFYLPSCSWLSPLLLHMLDTTSSCRRVQASSPGSLWIHSRRLQPTWWFFSSVPACPTHCHPPHRWPLRNFLSLG